MIFESGNIKDELKEKLLSYLEVLDESDEDLSNSDYDTILNHYMELMGDFYGSFDRVVNNYIEEFKLSNPDTTLNDSEIIFATDAYNPVNFIGIIMDKITYLKAQSVKENKSKEIVDKYFYDIPESNEEFTKAKKNLMKNVAVLPRAIAKQERLISKIQDEYLKENTHRR